jgi:hypothetical protein
MPVMGMTVFRLRLALHLPFEIQPSDDDIDLLGV